MGRRPSGAVDGREALLDATVWVVAHRGLRGMTFRAVAERAGVNNTLISYHFGSRHNLLVAAMEWAMQRSISTVRLADAIDHPEAFAQRLIEEIGKSPELQTFQYEVLLESTRSPELQARITETYRRYIDALATRLVEKGIDRPWARARALFAALDGLVLQQLTITSPDQVAEAIIEASRIARE